MQLNYEEDQVKDRLNKLDICCDPHDGTCPISDKCIREVNYYICIKIKCPTLEACPCYQNAKKFDESEAE